MQSVCLILSVVIEFRVDTYTKRDPLSSVISGYIPSQMVLATNVNIIFFKVIVGELLL